MDLVRVLVCSKTRREKEFEAYDLSMTPSMVSSMDPTAVPYPSGAKLSDGRWPQRNSSTSAPVPQPPPSPCSLSPASTPSSSKQPGAVSISDMESRLATLIECNKRKKTLFREKKIKDLTEGLAILRTGGSWVEPDDDDY